MIKESKLKKLREFIEHQNKEAGHWIMHLKPEVVQELLTTIERMKSALEHIASARPKCVGCTSPEVSLVEHYSHEARQALSECFKEE